MKILLNLQNSLFFFVIKKWINKTHTRRSWANFLRSLGYLRNRGFEPGLLDSKDNALKIRMYRYMHDVIPFQVRLKGEVEILTSINVLWKCKKSQRHLILLHTIPFITVVFFIMSQESLFLIKPIPSNQNTDSFQDGIPVGSLQGLLVSQHLLNAHCVLKEVSSISGLKKLTGQKGK